MQAGEVNGQRDVGAYLEMEAVCERWNSEGAECALFGHICYIS